MHQAETHANEVVMSMESKGNPSKINLFEGAADFPQNCTSEPRKGEIFRRGILRNRMEIFVSKVLSSFSGHGMYGYE